MQKSTKNYAKQVKRCAFLSFLFIFVFFLGTRAASADLSTPLKQGDTSADVVTLQKILNSDPETAVSTAGPGSPGNETAYFGALTKAAVIRFQNRYRNDVLLPVGLSTGTGYVGSYTLQKLNAVATGVAAAQSAGVAAGTNANAGPVAVSVNTQPSAVVPAPAAPLQASTDIYVTDKKIQSVQDSIVQQVNAAITSHQISLNLAPTVAQLQLPPVTITAIAPETATAGTQITIGGRGFDPINNTVYIGTTYGIQNVSSSANSIKFRVPNVPTGRYDIAVSNSKGMSNTLFFIITSSASPKVSVTDIEPQIISYGDTITITGTGFSKTNNEVQTNFGSIKGVSSADGTTLSVKIAPASLAAIAPVGNKTKEFRLSVKIINDNGYAVSTSYFTLKL